MESPKVINKVLLSSVAFGVSFGIGMLVSQADFKNELKALTTGALAATAGFAGVLVSDAKHREAERKKADGENLVEDSLPTGVQELKIQEDELHQSITEATMRMQEVEAGINSLQTEQAQLLENISDLHSQKQQLETQKETIETSISAQQTELEQIRDRVALAKQQQEELDAYLASLESRKKELETENQNLQAKIQELDQKSAQLAHITAPLEELKDIDKPSETSWNELAVAESIENDNSVGEVQEIFSEEIASDREQSTSIEEEIAPLPELETTAEDSEQFDQFSTENPIADGDSSLEELAREESLEQREEISWESESLSLEGLDGSDGEEIAPLPELETTAEDSEQFDQFSTENPIADGDSSLEELAQLESATEDFVSSEELMEDIEGIGFETTEQSSWTQLDNSEEEDATIVFTPSESTAEDSEDLDNLFDSTTTFDSESLENLMDETAELGILDIVGELAQPELLKSTTEESVTLESLINEAEIASPEELPEVQTELTNELDDPFFTSISEATEGESAGTQEDSFEQWEETSEELSQLADLSTSMSESSFQEQLEEAEEKLSELNSISEASLEEFEDLLKSIEEQNISMSFSDDIETTKTENLWD